MVHSWRGRVAKLPGGEPNQRVGSCPIRADRFGRLDVWTFDVGIRRVAGTLLVMSRLPFDPDRASGGRKPGDAPARRERKLKSIADAQQLTVSQLSELIRTTLEERIASPLRVIGQVSNLSRPNHWYFSLKDEGAVISCAAWASSVKKFGFVPNEGDEVVATGHVSHYSPQGRTQFYVSKLEPVGAGALELQFRAMCEELRSLGYFEESRKKPLPVFPRKIAVVTSKTGAAVQDVINTAAHRCKAVGLVLVPVKVQGEGAKEEVARAIRWVDKHHERLGVDAILVTRGGGSIEDLWAFNERIVADAAFNCSIPLVAAIGHESDTTVIELVADLRASTPTQAAMRLVPDAAELAKQINHHEQRLEFLIRRMIERQRERVESIAKHAIFRKPGDVILLHRDRVNGQARHLEQLVRGRVLSARAKIEQLAGRLGELRPMTIVSERHERIAVLADRLERAVHWRVRYAGTRLDAMERELIAVDPRQVLKRGYSYTTKRDGTLIRSIHDVRNGEIMRTNVRDGAIESIVGDSPAQSPGIAIPGRKSSRNRSKNADQMDLFGE
jgi:exodeoxyribonuclease VII large subunit